MLASVFGSRSRLTTSQPAATNTEPTEPDPEKSSKSFIKVGLENALIRSLAQDLVGAVGAADDWGAVIMHEDNVHDLLSMIKCRISSYHCDAFHDLLA
jgi:hypothetical protein